MKKLWELITKPFRDYLLKRRLKKRIKELRELDPFIYK